MWTKSQKVAGGVLALAVVAFGVDRFVLDGGGAGGASPAQGRESAESLVVPHSSSPPTTPALNPAQPTAAPGVSLAARLAAIAESRRLREAAIGDAFRPSREWVAAATPAPAPTTATSNHKPTAATPPPAAKVDHAADFQRTHVLTAIMKGHDGGMAIINGRLYKPGQLVDGFKLTKVGLKEARFWGQGQAVTLKLTGQGVVADAR
jgi:hypothetical protein